jgi:glycosyltransferase involved in cell wall biosynthesis
VSGQHAQGDRQTPLVPVALILGPRRSISFSLRVSCGLPVVTTSVGGLVEAIASYTGAVLVPPCDPAALSAGIRTAMPLVDKAHADPHSWARNGERYAALLDRIDAAWSSDGRVSGDRASEVA